MKTTLRVLAAVLLAASVALWLLAGAHRGWTKTSVPVTTLDAVTGISGVTYQRRFVPGLDFLAVAVTAAAAVTGASFLFHNKNRQPGE